ncbi:PREDICTED: putative nuclease HARBI1 isoform X1 [Vollenhovia emeryi]|nr:PREDICTED: putative nuclease HARBI1 isoform X1 [Vollenhovia emeryi]
MPSEDEAKFISLQFERKSSIPQLIGSIDGTHIPITAPQEGYRDFVNRKGWTSYNVMAVVDHNGRFRNVVIKHPGSVHDAAVFKDSSIYKNAQTIIPQTSENINGMAVPCMIVGDPAYPMLPWLIKGYSGSLSAEEESFNVYLNSARVSVEMAFGRLKARWRILCKKMDCTHTFSPQIILACCTLHNFVESNNERFLIEWLEEVSNSDKSFPQPIAVQNRDRDCIPAITVRNHLKQYLAANYPLRKTFIS